MSETAAEVDVPAPVSPARPRPVLTGVAYGVLLVLGVVLALVGGFQHAWYVGAVFPVAALSWVAALFGVFYGAGRLMGGKLGAGVPAVTWLLLSMLLATPSPEGDLAIAGDLAGYLYLYGGGVAVVVAVLLVPSAGTTWLLTARR
jgi:hypothetical protein